MADADPQWNNGLSPPQKRVNIGRWNTRRCGKIYMKAAPLNTGIPRISRPTWPVCHAQDGVGGGRTTP
jgi:hypothetical protein